jgi:formylglycine-generating enzyme required for sulfatase activity
MKYYEILDLAPDATTEQIKAAYRILVQLHHPDRLQQANEGVRRYAEDKLKRINEAYTVLSDPARRAQYDAALRTQKRRAPADDHDNTETVDDWDFAYAPHKTRRRPRGGQAAYEAVYEEWAHHEAEKYAEAREAERQRRAERERREAEERARRAEAERYPRVREDAEGLRLYFAPGQWTTLLRVPAGEFIMGADPALDPQASRAELPQHRVYVSEFFIGQYPVTNAQFQIFAAANRPQLAAPAEWQMPIGKETHPAVNVTWDEAVAFCQWLTRITGREFRLPTEAEWEKAARGPEGFIYPWGNEWNADSLNSGGRMGGTTAIGQYSPMGDSAYGLADMSGNVWEWCSDWHAERLYRSRVKHMARDPQGPATGEGCVARGGAFDSSPKHTRASHRNWFYPYHRRNNVGFRVAVGVG